MLLLLLGMLIGAVLNYIGLILMVNRQKRKGCFRHCENCGHVIEPPIV